MSPFSVLRPRNHPSPKSSSRSMSSMRSPRARLSSSGLRAWNSSVGPCQSLAGTCQCRLWSWAALAESGITYARRREGRPGEPRRWDFSRPWAAAVNSRDEEGAGRAQRESSGCCGRLPPALDIKCSSCSREVGAAAAQTWRCQWCCGRCERVQQRHERPLLSGVGECNRSSKGRGGARRWCWQRVGEALWSRQ